ncbi:MAG TPA: NAD(P)/FAD-dependent oxidoreductase, partial [Luteimonas sp.]|nr:NAD(P)/FAD-dependent oxidoreductase [Luteimonas sp.]
MPGPEHPRRIAVIGGGPAGLFAAERLCVAGLQVDLYEGKGSVGRKFLIAGKGGLNLTHSELRPGFDARYRERAAEVARWLDRFDADALREWARGLGVDTYVGSSGRVFPRDRKAAPLLRGWVRRLREQGVAFHVHHRWAGWSDDGALRFDTPGGEVLATTDAVLLALGGGSWPGWDHAGALRFETPTGEVHVAADATVLALGGGSWPELGSDGGWVPLLAARGVALAPLRAANCGFDIAWTTHFAQR